jgi:ankyrin repeat protein
MSGPTLIAAVDSRVLLNVIAELDAGAPPDFLGESGSPLQLAVSNNDLPIVNLLVERGATVDFPNATGETALEIAILNQRPILVQRLLDLGANANHRDSNGYTLLQLAVQGGSLAIVEKLLQAGATVDAEKGLHNNENNENNGNNGNNQNNQNNQNNEDEDDDGNTALFFAAMSGNIPIVERLLAAGANRQHENAYGERVQDVATPAVRDYLNQLPQQGGRRRATRKASRRRATRRRATRRKATRRKATRRRATRRH